MNNANNINKFSSNRQLYKIVNKFVKLLKLYQRTVSIN